MMTTFSTLFSALTLLPFLLTYATRWKCRSDRGIKEGEREKESERVAKERKKLVQILSALCRAFLSSKLIFTISTYASTCEIFKRYKYL